MSYKKVALVLVLCLFIIPFVFSKKEKPVPRNIVLMIGDGMGPAQVTAAKIANGTLQIERMKVGGLVMTYSSSSMVTDSAAAATAYDTGEKTYNGAISVDKNGKSLKTVAEWVEEKGKSTEVTMACSVTGPTAAAFFCS